MNTQTLYFLLGYSTCIAVMAATRYVITWDRNHR